MTCDRIAFCQRGIVKDDFVVIIILGRHSRITRTYRVHASPEKGRRILNCEGSAMLVSLASPFVTREVARSIREFCNALGNGGIVSLDIRRARVKCVATLDLGVAFRPVAT